MSRWFLFVLSLAVAGPALAGSFEGVLDYEIRAEKDKVFPMTYRMKGTRVRVDYGDKAKGAGIVDVSQKVMWILQPSKKTAIKMDLPQPKPGETPETEVKKTGRTETVAGRKCAVYTFKNENAEGESCNAAGMGSFMMGETFGGAMSAWQKESVAKGLFPLKVVTKDLTSGKTTTMIATRIEEKSLPASDFEVPSDYKVMDAPKAVAPAGAAAAPGSQDFMKKMMNATPAERQKMAEEMKKMYGGGK